MDGLARTAALPPAAAGRVLVARLWHVSSSVVRVLAPQRARV